MASDERQYSSQAEPTLYVKGRPTPEHPSGILPAGEYQQLGIAPTSPQQIAAQQHSEAQKQLISPYGLGNGQYDLARALYDKKVPRTELVQVFGEQAVTGKEQWIKQNTCIPVTNEWIATAELKKFSSADQASIRSQGTAKFNTQQKQKAAAAQDLLKSLRDYQDKNDPSRYNLAQAVVDGKTSKEQLSSNGFNVSTLDSEVNQIRAYNSILSTVKGKPYATVTDNSTSVDLSAALRDNLSREQLKTLGYSDAEIQKAAEYNAALSKLNDPKYRNIVDGKYNLQAIYHDHVISPGMMVTLFGGTPEDTAALRSASSANLTQRKKEIAKQYGGTPQLAAGISRTYLEYTVPGYATQRHWSQMSSAQKGLSVGLDVAAVLLMAGPVTETAADVTRITARAAGKQSLERAATRVAERTVSVSGTSVGGRKLATTAAGKVAAKGFPAAPIMKGILTTTGAMSAANTAMNWNNMNNAQRTFSVGITTLLLSPALISTGKYVRNSAVGEFKVAAERIANLDKAQNSGNVKNLRSAYGDATADAYRAMSETRSQLAEAHIDRATAAQGKGWLAPAIESPERSAARVSGLTQKITTLEEQLREQARNFIKNVKDANETVGTHESDLRNINRYLGISDEFYSRFPEEMVRNTRSAAEAITGSGKGNIEFYRTQYEQSLSNLQKEQAKIDATKGAKHIEDYSNLSRLKGEALKAEMEYELSKMGSVEKMSRELQEIRTSLKDSKTFRGYGPEKLKELASREAYLEKTIADALKGMETTDQYKYTYQTFGDENIGIERIEIKAGDGTYEYRFKGVDSAGNPQFEFQKTSSTGLSKSGGGRTSVIEMEPPKTGGEGRTAVDVNIGRMTPDQIGKLQGGLPLVHAVSSTAPGLAATPHRASEPEIVPGHLSQPEIRSVTGGSPEIAHNIQSIINNAIDKVPASASRSDAAASIDNALRNAAQEATDAQTKAQLQQKLQTLVELATDRAMERGTSKTPPPFILHPGTPQEKKLSSKDLEGAVARKQGFIYKLILQSGQVHDSREPIPGVPLLTGTGTASRSIISVGEGLSKTVIEPHGGAFEAQITPNRGGRPIITFKRKATARKRSLSPTLAKQKETGI